MSVAPSSLGKGKKQRKQISYFKWTLNFRDRKITRVQLGFLGEIPYLSLIQQKSEQNSYSKTIWKKKKRGLFSNKAFSHSGILDFYPLSCKWTCITINIVLEKDNVLGSYLFRRWATFISCVKCKEKWHRKKLEPPQFLRGCCGVCTRRGAIPYKNKNPIFLTLESCPHDSHIFHSWPFLAWHKTARSCGRKSGFYS